MRGTESGNIVPGVFCLTSLILVIAGLNLQYHLIRESRRERPYGLSVAHDSLDSDACVCWLLIVGWQKLALAGPGCLCSVSRGSVGISSSHDVHAQATSARETNRPFAQLLKSGPLQSKLPSGGMESGSYFTV